MKVIVKKCENEDFWYKGAAGKEFDVELKIHPTFGYQYYCLTNTDNNKRYFQNDELSLLVLKSGHFGISFENAIILD